MALYRTEKLVELLKEHPNGLHMEQLVEALNVKSNKDVNNTIQLVKKRGIKIINNNGCYSLKIETDLSKEPSVITPITDLLSKNPDGITTKELIEKLNLTPNSLYNRICYEKRKGINIISIKGKYYLRSISQPNSNTPINKTTMVSKETGKYHAESIIPKEYLDTFLSLSDIDKADCIDMLRKSLYYRKSALSILESNKEVFSFVSSIERGV